jgi:hypothetical protein
MQSNKLAGERATFEEVMQIAAPWIGNLDVGSDGDYKSMETQSAWWAWQRVSSRPLDIKRPTMKQQELMDDFQDAFGKTLYAVAESPENLFSIGDDGRYKIPWVLSAWVGWDMAYTMYHVQ